MKRSPIRRKPKPDPIAPEVRDQLRIRAGGLCEVRVSPSCKVWATEAHHRKLRRHGDHSLANLLFICRSCHRFIHARPELSHQHGWMVKAHEAPEERGWLRRKESSFELRFPPGYPEIDAVLREVLDQ